MNLFIIPWNKKPSCYLLHSHGKWWWPIEIDDFPSYKPPFSVWILHGKLLVIPWKITIDLSSFEVLRRWRWGEGQRWLRFRCFQPLVGYGCFICFFGCFICFFWLFHMFCFLHNKEAIPVFRSVFDRTRDYSYYFCVWYLCIQLYTLRHPHAQFKWS